MPDTTSPFNKGDTVIHHGQALIVKDIVEKENIQGIVEPHLVAEPEFVGDNQPMLKYTIPVSTLEESTLRMPISEDKLKKVWEALEHTPASTRAPGAIKGRDILKENDVIKTARLIKHLHHEKFQPDRQLPISKNSVLRNATKNLAQEIAASLGISPEDAREKINKHVQDTLVVVEEEE